MAYMSGDDLGVSNEAVHIYTWLVYGVLLQILNIFGIITNIINIICFAKQGYRDSVNISFTGLAVSDLCSLITMACTCFFLTPAVATADLPFEPFEVMYLTSGLAHVSFTRISSCITAMITLERCLCITVPLKIKGLFTPRRTTVITVCLFIVFFWSASPAWVVSRLDVTFSTARNRTIIGCLSSDNKESVEMTSFAINNFFIPFGAFMIIVICTAILSFQLRRAASWRQAAVTTTLVDNVSKRNQKTAKMVVMVSNLFIVCFIPVTVVFLAMAFQRELLLGGKYVHIAVMIGGIGYIMENLNSSMNIFIYYKMSTKYRDNFRKILIKTTEVSQNK